MEQYYDDLDIEDYPDEPEILLGSGLRGGAYSGGCGACGAGMEGMGLKRHCVAYKQGPSGKARCAEFDDNLVPGVWAGPIYPADYSKYQKLGKNGRPSNRRTKRNPAVLVGTTNPWINFYSMLSQRLKRYNAQNGTNYVVDRDLAADLYNRYEKQGVQSPNNAVFYRQSTVPPKRRLGQRLAPAPIFR